LAAVEIEKQQHEGYWTHQLNKLSTHDRISFVSRYFKCIDGNNFDASFLFQEWYFEFQRIEKGIVKVLYRSTVGDKIF
jgi:hypothetical protein